MNELEQLTSLLGGGDQNRLNRLEQRLNDNYQRAQDIAKVLPAVLRTLNNQGNLVEALQEPVASCVKKSMQQEPRSFVKAILPIISPLIRDTATNALKPVEASLREQQRQSDSIEKSLNNIEQAYVGQQGQLHNIVKQFGVFKQTHIDQIKDLHTSLQIQKKHLDELAKYFDNLEKAQINQHLQLDSLNKLIEKKQTDQQTQYDSLKNLIRDVFQKLKIRINEVNKQVDNVEQTHLDKFLKQTSENLEQFQQRCDKLEERISDPQKRTQDTADILPNAIRQASEITNLPQPDLDEAKFGEFLQAHVEAELAESLQTPVAICFQQSIKQDANTFANVLFPIMGPAIRKSINESFKVIVQRINKTLEESLSPKGIAWRLQSLRTGQPFSDIVLQQTLVFEVEQVFLMHRETGLLIQHLHKDGIEVGDSDAVSAMFTAIQDFVRDSFISNADSAAQRDLNTVEVGERTVWLEHSPYAVLACVIRGSAPVSFRNIMQSLLETIHARYGMLLQEFSGDNQPLQPCIPILQKAIHIEKKSKPTNWRVQLLHVGGIFGIILLFFMVWGYYSFKYQQRLSNYINVLQNTPGIVVVSSENQSGKLVIRGMRDPLADEPEKIALRFDLSNEEVVFKGMAYQDLNAKFVEQRLQNWLKPPATVQMSLQNTVLHLTGHADQAWIDKVNNSTGMIAGFTDVVADELVNTEAQFQIYVKTLIETAGITVVSSVVKNGQLFVTGMRDPLAEEPAQIAKRMQINDVTMRFTPYQDLTPQFVEQRVRQRLAPPATVKLHLENNKLYLSGYASQVWIDNAINKASTVAGVNQVESRDLLDTDNFLLFEAKRELKPPENVILSVHDRVLKVTANVDSATFQTLQRRLQNFQNSQPELASYDTSGLVDMESKSHELIQGIENTKIYFAKDATTFVSKQEIVLQNLLKNIQQLLKIGQKLHQSIHIQVIGNTDGVGTRIYNQQLSRRRAKVIVNWLQSHGIKKHFLIITPPSKIRFGESQPNPSNRNVIFLVKVE
jgi:outer membrane protein OmpA-like peptidoglycan-associated protein